MIGYTLPIKHWDEEGTRVDTTALVSLDVEAPDEPVVDIRLKDGDGAEYIVNCGVDDFYAIAGALDRDRNRHCQGRGAE